MILSCPACTARFEVPDSALGSAGRKVRCSACGHVWRAQPPAEAETIASAAPPAAPLATGIADEGYSAAEPPPSGEPAEARPAEAAAERDVPLFSAVETRPQRRQPRPPQAAGGPRSLLPMGWALLALVLIGLPALAWVERQQIAEAVPGSAALYALVGIEIEAPLAGLRLKDVTLVRRTIDGRRLLIVEGSATNEGGREVELPPLRARLLDAEGALVTSWTFLAQRTHLAPGEGAPFRTEAEDVPDEASISIEFLPNGSP